MVSIEVKDEIRSSWHRQRVVWTWVSWSGSDPDILPTPPCHQELPRYHELPTLEERSGPLLLGATGLGPPILVPPGPPTVVEGVAVDLEDEEEEEEEDYLDKINPIYDALSYSSPPDSYQGQGFVMSRAMYV